MSRWLHPGVLFSIGMVCEVPRCHAQGMNKKNVGNVMQGRQLGSAAQAAQKARCMNQGRGMTGQTAGQGFKPPMNMGNTTAMTGNQTTGTSNGFMPRPPELGQNTLTGNTTMSNGLFLQNQGTNMNTGFMPRPPGFGQTFGTGNNMSMLLPKEK